MSIERGKQQLANLEGQVDALAQEEINLVQEGRFGSLPERFTEIQNLAEHLYGLLGAIGTDLFEYQTATRAYYSADFDIINNTVQQNAGPRCAELASEAETILEGSNRALSVSSRIRMMGEPFGTLKAIGKNGLLGMSDKIENYRATVKRVGTFSAEMSGFLSQHRESIPEAITGRRNEITEIIQDIAAGLNSES